MRIAILFVSFFFFAARLTAQAPVNATASFKEPKVALEISSIKNKNNVIMLEWKVTTSISLSSFNLYRSTEPNAPKTRLNTIPIKITQKQFNDETAIPGHSYYYYLEALSGKEVVARSPMAILKFEDVIAPAKPATPMATSLVAAIQLNWNKSTEKDVVAYAVYRASRDEPNAYVLLQSAPIRDSFFTDSMNKNTSVSYYYRIVAIDSNQLYSEPSDAVTARPKDISAPYSPKLITALANEKRILLRWAKNPETDLAGYELYRLQPNSRWEKIKSVAMSQDSFSDLKVLPNVEYSYQLRAIDRDSNISEPSNVLNAELVQSRNTTSFLLEAKYKEADKSVLLQWQEPDVDDFLGYTVYRKTSGKSAFIAISKLLQTNGFIDKQSLPGIKYQYQVKLIGSNGASHESMVVEFSHP